MARGNAKFEVRVWDRGEEWEKEGGTIEHVNYRLLIGGEVCEELVSSRKSAMEERRGGKK
eukprot:250089-Hanusia_phi.AAC.6